MKNKTIQKDDRRYWFSFFLVAVMIVMCACGATEESQRNIEVNETAQEEVPASDTAESERTSAETMAASDSDIEESISGEDGLERIEEQILLEQENIKITALEMVEDSIWGKGIKLLVENDSDKNIGVGCNALIVNDYMLSDLFSTSVAAGKKANEVIYMSSGQLEAAGISNVGQIEIYFHIYDSDSWDTLFDSDVAVITTTAYESMDNVLEIDGQELYAQNGIRIVGQYVDDNSFWGTAVLLYIENASGKRVGINCDNMSVNGFMVTPLFSSTVYDGKKAFDDITLLSTELEENGINSVEDIEVNFHIYDAETYESIADTGAISFHVN